MLWQRASRLYGRIVPELFDLAIFLYCPAPPPCPPMQLERLRRRWDAPRRLLVAEISAPGKSGQKLLRQLALAEGQGWNIAARAADTSHWWIQARPLQLGGDACQALENAVDHWQQLGREDWASAGKRLRLELLRNVLGEEHPFHPLETKGAD